MCLYDRRGKKNITDLWGKHSSWHHKFNGFTIQKVVFQWNLGELLWCTIGLPQILQKFPGHKKDGAVDSFPDYIFFFIGCVSKLQGHEKVRESIADGVATIFPRKTFRRRVFRRLSAYRVMPSNKHHSTHIVSIRIQATRVRSIRIQSTLLQEQEWQCM